MLSSEIGSPKVYETELEMCQKLTEHFKKNRKNIRIKPDQQVCKHIFAIAPKHDP